MARHDADSLTYPLVSTYCVPGLSTSGFWTAESTGQRYSKAFTEKSLSRDGGTGTKEVGRSLFQSKTVRGVKSGTLGENLHHCSGPSVCLKIRGGSHDLPQPLRLVFHPTSQVRDKAEETYEDSTDSITTNWPGASASEPITTATHRHQGESWAGRPQPLPFPGTREPRET